MTSPDELRARVLSAAAAKPSLTRSQTWRRHALLLVAGVLWGLAAFSYFGGVRLGPRPTALAIETFVGTLGLALLGGWIAFGRGGTMLGRSPRLLQVSVFLAPLVYFVGKLVFTTPYEGMLADWPDRPGFRCLGLSMSVGSGLFIAMLFARRGQVLTHAPAQGAAMGAAAGMAAAVCVDLWCPVAHPEHLLLGHIFPVFLFAGLGAILGRWLLALRGRSRKG